MIELRIARRQVAQALGVTPPAVSAALVRGQPAACDDAFGAAEILAPAGENLTIRTI
jgi:predicted transcriptional regulator